MPKPFIKMSLAEFEELIASFNFSRTITEVHMHHTWRPNHSQYRGLPTINAMWEFHTQDPSTGWSDIAQHLSIAPDGALWSGRNWNRPPASAAGFNGNSQKGPFMFEMIGDFDQAKDPFADPQKAAVIGVIVALLRRWSLPVSALKFHNQMTDAKSCPGTAIGYEAFCKEVQAALNAAGKAPAMAKKRGNAPRAVEELRQTMEGELPAEDLAAPEFRADHLHFKEESFARRAPLSPAAAATAKAHLINLRDGRLSNSGVMSTSEADLEALFQVHLADALEDAKAENRPLRLMFFAHGGLNKEQGAVDAAISRVPWWLSNGIYPIFFIWETGLMETWGQMLERSVNDMWGKIGGIFGRRGFWDFVADHATDPAVEKVARSIGGVASWGGMKNSAEHASAKDTGGAWHTARLLKDFLKAAKGHPVELHAVGHSAGSIFHAHFLAAVNTALGAGGPSVKTLHHLAPAIRVDLFKQKVMPLLGKGIDSLTLYTMTDEKEREDTCAKVYKKSLLYLIHHALEPEDRCPIVGLQQSIRGDAALRKLFEPASPGVAEVIWSPVHGGARYSSTSLSHGGFDDDGPTMNSVCRRILGTDKIREYGDRPRAIAESAAGEPTNEQVALGILTEYALKKFGSLPATAAETGGTTPASNGGSGAPAIVRPASARKRALCIGIDGYPQPGDRLSGCVNDALAWRRFFDESGFKTSVLLNEQASFQGIVDAFGKLVSSADPGEVIAIVYAGHGGQVRDLDEEKGESDDGLDEALCCHDFRTGRMILDDELGELLMAAKEGVDLSFIVDACHAGTFNRGGIAAAHPAIPQGARARAIPRSTELDDANAAFRGKAGKKNKEDKELDLLFAASLPSQFANEISGSGVFTSSAMKVLRQNGGRGLTNAAFDEAVRAVFPREFRAVQQSKIYGSPERQAHAFLGGL